MPPSSEVAAAPAYNTRSHREGASASPSSATSGVLIARMEGILESVADALSSGHELRLELMTHGSRRSRRMQELRFPGRSLSEGQKFGTRPIVSSEWQWQYASRLIFQLGCF